MDNVNIPEGNDLYIEVHKGNPGLPFDQRMALMAITCEEYLRDALLQLATAAGISITNEYGDNKANFMLLEEIREHIINVS